MYQYMDFLRLGLCVWLSVGCSFAFLRTSFKSGPVGLTCYHKSRSTASYIHGRKNVAMSVRSAISLKASEGCTTVRSASVQVNHPLVSTRDKIEQSKWNTSTQTIETDTHSADTNSSYTVVDESSAVIDTKPTPFFNYFWPRERKLQVYLVLSLILMYYSKYFNIRVPFILQETIDRISKVKGTGGDLSGSADILITAAAKAILFYSSFRALSVVCAEIKTCLFSHVWNSLIRNFATSIFAHFHSLDSTFHMNQPSGILSVAYVRAIRGFQSVVFQTAFSVVPTLLELAMVALIFFRKFGQVFSSITILTFLLYSVYTIWVTEWRVSLRKRQVSVDNKRNAFLIDSFQHHETVKLFTSEKTELFKFDSYLAKLQNLSVKSTYAVGLLNVGQVLIFCSGLAIMLLTGLRRVRTGLMSVGDLVAVNTMLLQLAIPFNYIGFTYQEIMQSLVDMELVSKYMREQKPLIVETARTVPIHSISPRMSGSDLRFSNVSFHYIPVKDADLSDDKNSGEIEEALSKTNHDTGGLKSRKSKLKEFKLKNISFNIKAGQHVAIVGPSGSGKSTVLKLISRMMTPDKGSIYLDGAKVNKVTVESLRQRVAVIPQDTSLFDNTLKYNILYGRASATDDELQAVIMKSNLQKTLDRLAKGLDTPVGPRGGRLSGGERQKVSIARALLRKPSLLLCDEVTSSVDALSERDIVTALEQMNCTTITVAHRLSSIVHCDQIFVMTDGEIIDVGTHNELMQKPNSTYRTMWDIQNQPIVLKETS